MNQKETKRQKRNKRRTEVLNNLAQSHGYAVTHKDKSGVDEFVDALATGEAITLLLADDDYTLALAELPRLAALAHDAQSAELIAQLVAALPTD